MPTIVLRKLSRLTREEASAMRPDREAFHECAVVMLDMYVRAAVVAWSHYRICPRASTAHLAYGTTYLSIHVLERVPRTVRCAA